MSKIRGLGAVESRDLTVVVKDYDHVSPLASGDVKPDGIDMTLVRDTPGALGRTLEDETVDVGELSFSRHLIRLANGDRSFVGIPVFPTRGFRERNFFVLEGSDLRELSDLAGKRVGTNEWPATGNTWSRAVLRERGVDIGSIDWRVGPVNSADKTRDQGELPSNVRPTGAGETLLELLHGGDLDALMVPLPPEGLYDDDSPVVRLHPDYPRLEKEYYRRTGINPPHHLVGIRREVFERDPWIARSLYDAFDRSKALWQDRRRRLNDTTPWLQHELETVTELVGEDWLPYGVEANREEIELLCEEEYAQGLIDEPLDPDAVFTEYEALLADGDD